MIKCCTKCSFHKDTAYFNIDRSRKDGLSDRCKSCTKTYDKVRRNDPGLQGQVAVQKVKWQRSERGRATARKNLLLRKWGMTKDEYENLLQGQCGKCGICQKDEPIKGLSLAVDHNHKTDKKRGLLCSNCNKGIGFLQDSEELLEKAIVYLRKYSE